MRERIIIYGSMTIALLGLIATVSILRSIRPVNRCLRSHIEINNVPQHTVSNGTVIPANRVETEVCDDDGVKNIHEKRYEQTEAQ